jgi:predicted ATP-grasp superfamily ATP-dependent carboligase
LKVAILEYICSSGVFRDCVPEGNHTPLTSLLAEGYAMLSALTNDMIDAGVNVCSPLEPTIAAWPRWRTWTDSQWTWSPIPYDLQRSVDDVATHWIELSHGCDAAIVIAPELDGILPRIIARLRDAGISVLASDERFLTTACDQWRTCQTWQASAVRHPDTYLLEEFLRNADQHPDDRLWVLKRRDSAGCVGLQRFEGAGAIVSKAAQDRELRDSGNRWVVQPWIPGTAASLAILSGERNRVLGAFEQQIEPGNEEDSTEEDSTQWGYCGGSGPIPGLTLEALERFADDVLRAIPGKPQGWIGIDFIMEPDGQWCAIEVNPRLTTSYLGYRKWYGHRLAGSWASGQDFERSVDSDRGNSLPQDLQEFPRVRFSVEAFEG